MTRRRVACPVRFLASAVLLALLAGCAAPEDGEDDDPLLGLCPQWVQGGGQHTFGHHLAGDNATETELGPAEETYLDRPLDLYRLRLTRLEVDGRLELRAVAADGRQLAIRDYRQEAPQLVPVVVFTDGSAADHEFDVFLSPVTHDAPAAPAPVTLRWTLSGGDATVGADVTYHYKVCGTA